MECGFFSDTVEDFVQQFLAIQTHLASVRFHLQATEVPHPICLPVAAAQAPLQSKPTAWSQHQASGGKATPPVSQASTKNPKKASKTQVTQGWRELLFPRRWYFSKSRWLIRTVGLGYVIQFTRRPPRFSAVLFSLVEGKDTRYCWPFWPLPQRLLSMCGTSRSVRWKE